MFDFWIILTACIIAINSSILGSFLVLKKMSLIGDALSHAVLPGIVIAFLISGEINSFWMLLGASGFGIIAILLIDWLNRVGGFGKDSSIGIIYTLLFWFINYTCFNTIMIKIRSFLHQHKFELSNSCGFGIAFTV